MAASTGAAEAGGWPRDELLRLIQAWGEVVESPRDREKLSAPELLQLHSRFEALCGRRGDRWLGSVERKRLRLVAAYRFIQAFNSGGRRTGRSYWFDMSRALREQAKQDYADDDSIVMAIDEEMFQAIGRVLREEPPSIDAATSSNVNTDATETNIGGAVGSEADASGSNHDPPTTCTSMAPTTATGFGVGDDNGARDNENEANSDQDRGNEGERPTDQGGEDRESEIKAAEALAGLPIFRVSTSHPSPPSTPASRRGSGRGMDEFYGTSPPLRWRLRDELQLIRAWDDTLRRLVEAKEPCFALNALVLERYTEICGPNEESASSIGAKRLKILGAFEFLREYLQSRPSDAPQWFEMAVSERLAEQKANGYYQGFACTLEAAEFNNLSSIMGNQRRLDHLNRGASRSTTGDSGRYRNYSSQPPTLGFDSDFDPADGGRSRGPWTHRSARDHRNDLPPRHRAAPDIAGSAVLISLRNASKRRRMASSLTQHRCGEETKLEEDDLSQGGQASNSIGIPPLNLMDQLVQAQSRRLELLLEEFREERREERQQTQELLLLLLSRIDAVPRDDVAALEALVEQQRHHLEQLFELVEAEREVEWGRAQELLSEIESGQRGRR